MPRIPIITRSVSIPGQTPQARFSATDFGAAAAAGIGRAARVGSVLLDRELVTMERTRDFNFVSERTQAAERSMVETFQTARRDGDPTDPAFARALAGRFAEIGQAALAEPAGASPIAQARARATIARISTRLSDAAGKVQRDALRTKALGNFQGSVREIAAGLSRGEALTTSLENLAGLTFEAKGAIDAKTLAKLNTAARAQLAIGAVGARLAARDIAGAKSVLADKRFDRDLNAATRRALGRDIEIAVRRAAIVSDDTKRQAADYLERVERGGARDLKLETALARAGGSKFALKVENAAVRAQNVNETVAALKYRSDAEIAAGLAKATPDRNDRTTTRADFRAFDAIRRGLGTALRERARDRAGFYAPEVERLIADKIAAGALPDPTRIADEEDRAAAETQLADARLRLTTRLQQSAGFADVLPIPAAALDGIAARIDAGTPSDAVGEISAVKTRFGANGVRQLTGALKGKRPHLALVAMFGARGTRGQALARDIVTGARALRATKDLAPKPRDLSDALDRNFGELFSQVPELRAMFAATMRALVAGEVLAGGDPGDTALLDRVAQRAAGALPDANGELAGGTVTRGGRAILLPVGVGEDGLDRTLAAITDNDLVDVNGGQPILAGGRKVTADMIRREGKLVSVGFGRYAIELGGGLVQARLTGVGEIDLKRPVVQNPDGTVSTEKTITVTDPRLNAGAITNIPSIVGGRVVSQEEAIVAAVKSKKRFPSFGSIPDAIAFARRRSRAIGQLRFDAPLNTYVLDLAAFIENNPSVMDPAARPAPATDQQLAILRARERELAAIVAERAAAGRRTVVESTLNLVRDQIERIERRRR